MNLTEDEKHRAIRYISDREKSEKAHPVSVFTILATIATVGGFILLLGGIAINNAVRISATEVISYDNKKDIKELQVSDHSQDTAIALLKREVEKIP